MDEFPVGKILPNLTVSVGTDNVSTDLPDSVHKETDVDTSKVQIVRPSVENFRNPKVRMNKIEGFTTGIDLIAQEESGILNKRAERFHLDGAGNKQSISEFYESLGIDIKNRNSVEMKKVRFNAIHLRGVEELSENEVLHYFNDFGPSEVEWINDASCNIIFPDEATATRALFNLSTDLPDTFPVIDLTDPPKKTEALDVSSLKIDDKEHDLMDIDDSPAAPSEPVNIPIPPGYWRLGTPHPKAKTLVLRFAKKDDKKIPGAEKRSIYYQIHGNPNYEGLTGLISSSKKHRIQAEANRLAVKRESSSSYKSFPSHQFETHVPKVTKPKKLRMRMYADDEELKTKKTRSKKHLTESRGSVHSRLGGKYTADDLCQLGTYRDSANGIKDSYKYSSYARVYEDLDNPKFRDSNNDFQDSYSRKYKDYDRPRSYKTLDRHRADKDSSSSVTYEFGIKSRSSWDLRSKLKRNRNEAMKPYSHQYSRSYNEEKDHKQNYTSKKLGRVDQLKKDSKSFFKRKHRSPLCDDDDDEEEEEEEDYKISD